MHLLVLLLLKLLNDEGIRGVVGVSRPTRLSVVVMQGLVDGHLGLIAISATRDLSDTVEHGLH